ncbi:MAG: hypothetical protein ACR2OD_13070 [Gaiellaceae bacterium]
MTSRVDSLPTSIEELNALSREELVDAFLTLSAPAPGELVGELDGFTPDYLAAEFAKTAEDDGFGVWLGKGFVPEPHDAWSGHGYNVWDSGAETARRVRFGWGVSNSILDGRPCAIIEYRAFNNAYADLDLTDEIRKLADGLYLGIATTDGASRVCPWGGGQGGRSLPTTFLLRAARSEVAGPDDPAGERRS